MESDSDYDKFVEEAIQYLNEKNSYLEKHFDIGSYNRFDINQVTGMLSFSNAGVARVYAPFKAVGSISHTSHTWLWAWANLHFLPNLRGAAKRVKRFGQSKGFHELVEPKFPADEEDGWRLTAITAYVLKSAGGYRCPTERVTTFVVLSEVLWAS